MGQGRRWLSALAVLLCALTALAGELPEAPSSDRPMPPIDLAELRDLGASPAFDAAAWVAQPTAVAQPIAIAQPIVSERPAKPKKVFEKKFALLAGLAAGLTIADFEMTQHCLKFRTCAEADPLMPTSHAGMYASNMPLNAALFWWSYRRKQDGKRLWWLAPLVVVGSHAAGIGTNLRFIGK
jgi:hypothetical protein